MSEKKKVIIAVSQMQSSVPVLFPKNFAAKVATIYKAGLSANRKTVAQDQAGKPGGEGKPIAR